MLLVKNYENTDYPYTLHDGQDKIYCREEPVENTDYNKFVTSDGYGLILLNPSYGGGGWAGSRTLDRDTKNFFLFNSELIKFKLNNSNEILESKYIEFMKELTSNRPTSIKVTSRVLDVEKFNHLTIDYVKKGDPFIISQYDDSEYIDYVENLHILKI